jgi:hypothetical protein
MFGQIRGYTVETVMQDMGFPLTAKEQISVGRSVATVARANGETKQYAKSHEKSWSVRVYTSPAVIIEKIKQLERWKTFEEGMFLANVVSPAPGPFHERTFEGEDADAPRVLSPIYAQACGALDVLREQQRSSLLAAL